MANGYSSLTCSLRLTAAILCLAFDFLSRALELCAFNSHVPWLAFGILAGAHVLCVFGSLVTLFALVSVCSVYLVSDPPPPPSHVLVNTLSSACCPESKLCCLIGAAHLTLSFALILSRLT